jgi:ribonuclease HII
MVNTKLLLPPDDVITVYTDEVGRGSLIYDVVAAAVIMPSIYDEDDTMVDLIRDSKKCSHKQLLKLSDYIKDVAIAWGVGAANVHEIDTHNILNASMMAMHRALDVVHKQVEFDSIYVDGNRFKPYMTPDTADYIPHTCIIQGDATYLGIAASSILAKVHRDTCVEQLATERKEYSDLYHWNSNKGYGTKDHIEALWTHGPTIHHRLSFKPVTESANKHKYQR